MGKLLLTTAGWAAGLVLAGAAVLLINLVWFRPWGLRAYFEKTFFTFFVEQPEALTAAGLVEQYGYRRHNAHLDDASIAHTRAVYDKARELQSDLRGYATEGRTHQERLSLRVLDWYFSDALAGERFAFHDYPVNQLFGVQSETVNFMVNVHRLADGRDAKDYIRRLSEFGRKFDQVIEGLHHRAAQGVIPPRFVLDRVLAQIDGIVAPSPGENVLVTHFSEQIGRLPRLTDSRRKTFVEEARIQVSDTVYPAYARLRAAVAALREKATEDDGVWKLPDGDAYYAMLLRRETTTNLSAAEIHEIGLREVARIEAEMRSILLAQGHEGRTPGEWLQWLVKEPRFLYPNTDEGRREALARYTEIAHLCFEESRSYFDTLPKAPMEVRRVPEFAEATAPGAYYMSPAMDSSRPGVFYANLRDMAEVDKMGMKTLTYHEGIPGHHFQIAIANELEGLPLFRKTINFNAYVEGWALYAEWLAVEMGMYKGDPYSDLGRLSAEMFRAVRLVVDTGIHAKRWTREQAIRYMVEKTGMVESAVVSEVERYIVMPAQACSYKIGMLKMQELRRRAEAKLGSRFDLKAFHDVLLTNGQLPLEILEEEVDAWIADRSG